MLSYTSQVVGYGLAFMDTVMQAFTTLPAAKLINTAKLRLSHDPAFSPTPGSTIAALAAQEANFTGYPAGGAAFATGTPIHLAPSIDGAGTAVFFQATTGAPFTADTVYGYWVDDGTNVIAYERFAGGVAMPFTSPGVGMEMVVFLPFPLSAATA